MNLPIPVVGGEPGPDYAQDVNNSLTLLDRHDHSSGSGVQVTPAGLNINSDLSFQGSNLTLVRSVNFQVQPAALSGAADVGCMYEVGDDLYYNDGSGNQIRITQGGAVAGTPGSIANLVSPASATYVSAASIFVFQSDANTAANLDIRSLKLRNSTASSNALTLSPPAAMGANYSLTLPSVPGTLQVVNLDASGNMGTISYDGVGQAMSATGADAIGASMSSTGANAVGVAMGATGANAVAAARTRTTGSSTAGIGGIAVSASSGTFISSGFVTGVTVTITTSGRPVMVCLASDNIAPSSAPAQVGAVVGSPNAIGMMSCNIMRGSTYVVSQACRASANTSTFYNGVPSSSVAGLDFVAAGTYTYVVYLDFFNSNLTPFLLNSVLVAYEI